MSEGSLGEWYSGKRCMKMFWTRIYFLSQRSKITTHNSIKSKTSYQNPGKAFLVILRFPLFQQILVNWVGACSHGPMSSDKTPGTPSSSLIFKIFKSHRFLGKILLYPALGPHPSLGTLPTSSNLPLVQSDRSICLPKGKPLLPPHPGLPVPQRREPATPFIKPLAGVAVNRLLSPTRLTPALSSLIHRR
jgi:hypothetical protein